MKRRHIIQGAAVVVTLGSRPAWGNDLVCAQLISANTMASFTGGSLSPGQEDLLRDLERAQRDASTQVTTTPQGDVCIAPAAAAEPELYLDRTLRQREKFGGSRSILGCDKLDPDENSLIPTRKKPC